jgi:hypothetical protein
VSQTKDALFEFICRAQAHQSRPSADAKRPVNPITIHGRSWAYCPCGAETGHDWQQIEGLSLEEVMRQDRALA